MLAIAGAFLLANGILFRNPKSLVEERFGRRSRSLASIRDLMFHRVQMGLGFGYLLLGFGLQLYARLASEPPVPPRPGAIAAWIGLVLVVTVLLAVAGWRWSLHAIRRTLRTWLIEHPGELEGDAALAREVGVLYEIAPHADDTVPSYVARLRHALELGPATRRPTTPPSPPSELLSDSDD